MSALRRYTRWTTSPCGALIADLVGVDAAIRADRSSGQVQYGDRNMQPDEARLIGVRLIEAAALADGERAIRATGVAA